jgi:uncharacterized membrane protein YbhN (UPF0104 family)
MCMSCNTGKLTTKKKIILFSSLSVGVAVASYFALTTTNNPAVAAALPTVFAFGACPLMCAAMGGAMWFSRRISKSKNKVTSDRLQDSVTEEKSCCAPHENREYQQKLESNVRIKEIKTKDSIPIPDRQNKI